MSVDIKLLEFCLSPEQRDIIQQLSTGMSVGEYAKANGTDERGIYRKPGAKRLTACGQ